MTENEKCNTTMTCNNIHEAIIITQYTLSCSDWTKFFHPKAVRKGEELTEWKREVERRQTECLELATYQDLHKFVKFKNWYGRPSMAA